MRRNAWIFIILLGIGGSAEAQTPTPYPRVEVGGTVGILSAKPGGENEDPYNDEWYGSGRYSGSIAYYWTKHLKTEFEHQWSHEGWLNYMEYTRINGVPYSTHALTFHQLQQSSLKMVWQFGDNSWVHPYVSGGAVVDIERRHFSVEPFYDSPRGGKVVVRNGIDTGHGTDARIGATFGAGAKMYMSKNAFFNTGVIGTVSTPKAKTVSLVIGFGVDF
jgi:Outer membrane protein beta-barrel domain